MFPLQIRRASPDQHHRLLHLNVPKRLDTKWPHYAGVIYFRSRREEEARDFSFENQLALSQSRGACVSKSRIKPRRPFVLSGANL